MSGTGERGTRVFISEQAHNGLNWRKIKATLWNTSQKSILLFLRNDLIQGNKKTAIQPPGAEHLIYTLCKAILCKAEGYMSNGHSASLRVR